MRDPHGHVEVAQRTQRLFQVNRPAIDLDASPTLQALRDVLRRDGAIQTALRTDAHGEPQGLPRQPLGQLTRLGAPLFLLVHDLLVLLLPDL